MGYRPIDWRVSGGQSNNTSVSADWLDDPDPQEMLNDPRFLEEYREMRKRQPSGGDADNWTDDELRRDFYQRQTYTNNGIVGSVVDYGLSKFADDAQKARMARIQRAYEMAPTRSFSDGEAWQDWLGAIVLDPTNLIPIGAGAKATWGAAKAGKGLLGMAGAGAKAGAKYGMLENAAYEGALDFTLQSRNIETGLQDERDWSRTGFQAGVGGAFGAGLGGVLGGAAGAASARGMTRLADSARRALPEETFDNLTYEAARQNASAFPAIERENAEIAARAEAEAATTPAPAEPTPTEPVTPTGYSRDAMAQALSDAQAELDEMLDEGAPRKEVALAERNVATMLELQRINELADNFEANTGTLMEADDYKTRAVSRRNAAIFVRLQALARQIERDPSAATLRGAREELTELEGELAARTAPPPEAVDGEAPTVVEPEGDAPSTEATPAEAIPPTEAQRAGDGTADEAVAAEPTPRPEDGDAEPSEPTPEDLFDEDDDVWEAFDILEDEMAAVKGDPSYREIYELMAGEVASDRVDDLLRIYDATYKNPNGLPEDAFAKLQAAEQPVARSGGERGAQQRAAKNQTAQQAKGGGPDLGEAVREMAGPESMRDQLRGVLGKLVRDPTARDTIARQSDEAAARASANAKATPQGQVRNPGVSGTGRAARTLEEGPVNAGQNSRGRAQAILKQGRATERDPVTGEVTRTITDGDVPYRSTLPREEFELEARRNAVARTIRDFGPDGKPIKGSERQTEAVPVSGWVADRDMTGVIGGTTRTYATKRGKTRTDVGFVPKGTTLFYAPQTQRYYVNKRDALTAIGRAPARTFAGEAPATGRATAPESATVPARAPEEVAEQPTPEVTPEPEARVEDPDLDRDAVDAEDFENAKQLLRDGAITPAMFRAILRAYNQRQAKNSDDPITKKKALVDEAVPSVDAEDRVLAIRKKDNPNSLRILSAKQAEQGQGVSALLGKADPDDWEVGYVPRGTRGSAAAKAFTPDADFETRIADVAKADAEANAPQPIGFEEAWRTPVDITNISGEELDLLNQGRDIVLGQMSITERADPRNKAILPRLARPKNEQEAEALSVSVFQTRITTLEMARWPRDRETAERLIDSLAAHYKVLREAAPGGIARPTATKKEALAQLDSLLAKTDPKDLARAREVLEALPGDKAPSLVRDPNNLYRTHLGDESRDNRIGLTSGGNPSLPRSFIFTHELGHWAYDNVLDDADRLEFWRTVAKNYYREGGRLDTTARMNRSLDPLIQQNSMESPSEFFANQFATWVTQKRFQEGWADRPFWERIFARAKALFDSITRRDFADPELEPLFQKILPEDAAEDAAEDAVRTFVPLKPNRALKTKQSEYTVAHINALEMTHGDLQTAILHGDVDTAIETARTLADHIFKLTGVSNAFRALTRFSKDNPQGNVVKISRDAAYKLARAINEAPDEDALTRINEDAMAHIDDGNNPYPEELADAAEIWLSKADNVSTRSSPEATFEAIKAIMDDGTDTSVNSIVQLLEYRLNRQLKNVEGWSFNQHQLPKAWAGFAAKKAERAARKAETPDVLPIKKKQERAKKKIEAEAVKEAKTPQKKRKKPAAPESGAAPKTRGATDDLKDAAVNDLLNDFPEADETYRASIANELLRRQKAQPDPGWEKAKVTVPRDIMAARADDMEGMLAEAMAAGDGPRIEQIMYEAWRRGESRRRKKAGKPPLRANLGESTRSFVEVERAQTRGLSEDGITPEAPAIVREIQSFMSHRDPEVQLTMRTLTYRLLNMMGKTMRDSLDETNILTTGDIYRLANTPQPANAKAAFADFRNEGFSKLRSDLRRLSIGLTRDVSDPFDVMHEVHHLALRTGLFNDEDRAFIGNSFVEAARGGDEIAAKQLKKYGGASKIDALDPSTLETVAEEWFAESGAIYAMGKVARGDMFAVRSSGGKMALAGKSKLVELANRLIEGVAYLANGLMGRRTMKQMFRRLDHGDMFADNRLNFFQRREGVPKEYASAHYADVLASQSDVRADKMRRFARSGLGIGPDGKVQLYYHGTPNGAALSQRDVVMGKGSGDFGEGIYATLDPQAADQVYARRSTLPALERMIDERRADGALNDEQADEARLAADLLTRTRREVSFLRNNFELERGETPVGDGRVMLHRQHHIERLEGRLADALEYESELVEHLGTLGVQDEPLVMGLVIRAENPADLTGTSSYAKTDPMVVNLITDLEEQGHIDFDDAQSYYTDLDDMISGRDLHGDLTNLVMKTRRSGYKSATAAISRALGARGYDAIKARFPNTLADGTKIEHDGVVLIDHVDPSTGETVSASSKLKSIDAAEFDETSDMVYASLMDETPAPNTYVLNRMMMEGAAERGPLAAEVISRLEGSGAPKDFTQHIASMVRGRAPDAKKTGQTLYKYWSAFLGETSRRLELAGMNTIADWHRAHHVDQAAAMGDRVFAMRDLLETLPDRQSGFRRWLNDSYDMRPGSKQPASHARIFKALRMGLESKEAARLSEAEMKAARGIRSLLDAEFRNLREAGVIVGHVENYVPQIWRVEALQKDPELFVEKLANYFQAEAGRDGRKLSRIDAKERAQGVWGRLIDDEGQYLPPPAGSSRSVDSDHLRYQRLIRLDDPEFSLNASDAELGQFLENDLEATLIKYFDGSTRSILQGQRFGTLNHGYYDYLRVMDKGLTGIAELLSTNRVARRDLKGISPDGNLEAVELRDETPMPFQGDEPGARQAASEVHEIFERDGAAAARDYLMKMDVSKAVRSASAFAPAKKSTYEHRVEAIISALKDGRGEAGAAKVKDIQLAETAMQTAMRKRIGTGPLNDDTSHAVSRGLRTFNALSLLSFTTLTSLPDAILPLISSGQTKAYMRAWSRMAKDPEYRRAMKATGVAIESIVHSRMAGLFATDMSGKLGRANTRFFNMTGLTPWTDTMRQIAGATGFEALRTDVARAIKMRVGDGSDINAQTPEYRQIMRRLNHYGMQDFVSNNRSITDEDLADPAVKRAVIQFANESIFAPTPDEMPLWTQTPWGAVVWQLKSYPTMLMRLALNITGNNIESVRRAVREKNWRELDPREAKRLGYLMALAPAAGAATLGAKDIVQMRGGEENREAELRDRRATKSNIVKLAGYEEGDLGDDADAYLGWYIEGMLAIGGFGLIADLLHATVENADNGAYGQSRQLSFLLGPSAGTVTSGMTVLGGALDQNEGSNAKERAAWREALRRVPVVGGLGSVREGVVDAMAGEQD